MARSPRSFVRQPPALPDGLLPLRPADMQILLLLARGPCHAYGISKASEEAGAVSLGIGSLYRTLNRLSSLGLIAESGDDDAGPQGQTRRPWRLTVLGREAARREAQRLQAVVESARAGGLLSGTEP